MDPITILVAKLAGPAIFAMGVGVFLSRNYYEKVYRNLESETLAVVMGGITILVAGIAIVLNHNIWNSFPAGFVSALGWLSILKGVMLLAFPKMVDNIGDAVAESRMFPFIAVLALLAGGYLSYIGYFI